MKTTFSVHPTFISPFHSIASGSPTGPPTRTVTRPCGSRRWLWHSPPLGPPKGPPSVSWGGGLVQTPPPNQLENFHLFFPKTQTATGRHPLPMDSPPAFLSRGGGAQRKELEPRQPSFGICPPVITASALNRPGRLQANSPGHKVQAELEGYCLRTNPSRSLASHPPTHAHGTTMLICHNPFLIKTPIVSQSLCSMIPSSNRRDTIF